MRAHVRTTARLLGLPILVLGAWGAIVPFAGPAFGYPMPPGSHIPAWTWNASHAELHVAAGVGAVAGGLLLLAGATRGIARLGGWLGLLGGAWFVLGPIFSPAFLASGGMTPAPASTFMHIVTPLGYHYGTGLTIAALSALALGLLARGPVMDESWAEERDAPMRRESLAAADNSPRERDRVLTP